MQPLFYNQMFSACKIEYFVIFERLIIEFPYVNNYLGFVL